MRDVLDLGGISMLRVDDCTEIVVADVDAYDLIAVRGKRLHDGIVSSPRIEWFMEVREPTLIERFVGNHRRKLKRTLEQMSALGITLSTHDNISREQFEKFLSIYRNIIGSKEHARLHLTDSSYDELREHPLHAVFAYRDGELLGGTLVRDYGHYYALSYSAYPQFARKELEVGLGAPLFSVVYCRSVAESRHRVSYGIDTNMYGMHLSVGLLEYKLSIGCAPVAKELEGYSLQTVYVVRKPSSGIIAWYRLGPDAQMQLCVATDMTREDVLRNFSHAEQVQQQWRLTECVEMHRKALLANCI